MIGALRIFAFLFFCVGALLLFVSFASGFNPVGFGLAAGVVFSGVLCAAAANGLETLEQIEQNSRNAAASLEAMHRTIALNTRYDQAA